MAAQQSLMKNILTKIIVGLVVGGIFVGLANVFAFPPVFQAMFFLYAMLGAAVFILLDAPSLGTVGGVKAIVGLSVFYIVVSTLYIGGASLLSSTTRADGFVIIPADSEGFPAGANVDVFRYDS